MAWLFGDTFDHYTDPLTKYDAVGHATTISLGTGRYGTHNMRFAGAGSYVLKGFPAANVGAFATMALSLRRTGAGRWGFANLWSGNRGHVVFARQDDGAITWHRQTANEGPLVSSAPASGSTPPGVWPVNRYVSVELFVAVHPNNGTIRIRVNGTEVLTTYGVPTANPNAAVTQTGWYLGMEQSLGTLDLDDLMLYTDQYTGVDGIVAFLGDLTGECLFPRGDYFIQWMKNLPGAASNGQCVAEPVPDGDVSYVEAGIVNSLDLYYIAALRRVSQGIRSLQLVITARKTGANVRGIAGEINDFSVDYIGPTITLDPTYRTTVVPRPLASNGANWTMDQVNATLYGVRVVV